MYELAVFFTNLNPWQKFVFLYILYEFIGCLYCRRKSLIFIITRNLLLGHKPNDIFMFPTLFSLPFLIFMSRERFFIKQLNSLFEGLEENIIYTTDTHNTIIKQIKTQARLGKIEIIDIVEIKKNEKKDERFLFLEKIQLLNFSNLTEKKQAYRIFFRKKEPFTT